MIWPLAGVTVNVRVDDTKKIPLDSAIYLQVLRLCNLCGVGRVQSQLRSELAACVPEPEMDAVLKITEDIKC